MTRIETLSEDVTLYHGDSIEILPGLKRHDALVTDPPYGMAFQSNHRTVAHEKITGDDEVDMLLWACGIKTNHSAYIFCRWDNLHALPKPRSCITWVKNNWGMGNLTGEHARRTEIILFYAMDNHFFPGKRPQDVVYADRTGNNHHPTEKPVDLMMKVIDWTRGVILDPFMGSGTTGVAAVKMGRKFTGVEINEKYFDISCRRIEEALAQPDMFISA